MKHYLFAFLLFVVAFSNAQTKFENLCSNYMEEYKKLEIPSTELDYRINFKNIQEKESLKKQEKFFSDFNKQLNSFTPEKLNADEKIRFAQLKYETTINLERITLEKNWNKNGRKIPENGLHAMPDYKEWYSYYIKHFTSVNISPEEVFEMGQSEVKKVQQQIKELQTKLGFI